MVVTKAQITRRASKDGVGAKTVERDYVLAHAVSAIAQQDRKDCLAFKGGTSLRFLHFDDYRYSADLDFSVLNGSKSDAFALIAEALHASAEAGPTMALTEDDPPRISYVGPLGRKRTLKLDLAEDELVVHTERSSLLPRWTDVEAAKIRAYTLLEVAGEKLRCILQRLQCRDLFDLDVLFGEAGVDAQEAAELFFKKAKHRGLDPSDFARKYTARKAQYKARFQRELSEHLGGDVPEFEALERRVARQLRSGGLFQSRR